MSRPVIILSKVYSKGEEFHCLLITVSRIRGFEFFDLRLFS